MGCEICNRTPHLPLCPEAPDPVSVFICSGCGEPIWDGEDYWDVMGEQFCEHCIDDMKGVAQYDPD